METTHSNETWNNAEERLTSFCETPHIYHGNSRFQIPKERRWTHNKSPNWLFKHELDQILRNREIFTYVALVPSFQTGIDHLLLQAKLHFDKTRAVLEQLAQKTTSQTTLDVKATQRLADMHDFDELNDLDEYYEELEAAIADIRKPCNLSYMGVNKSTAWEEKKLKSTAHNHLKMTRLNR